MRLGTSWLPGYMRRCSRRLVAAVLVAVVCGVGCDEAMTDPAKEPVPELPAWPANNDPAFIVSGLHAWYLVGNALTPGQDTVALIVRCATPPAFVHAFVDSSWAGTFTGGDSVAVNVPIGGIGPGLHTLRLSADTADTAFVGVSFNRTHPLYVVVSNDWDLPRDTVRFDSNMVKAQMLHARYPGLKITHLVGPYAFTDPIITETRRSWFVQQLLSWVRAYGDEIGLHIHPFCCFVEQAGLACRDEPVGPNADWPVGYLTPCYAYPKDEFSRLLAAADSIFAARGLPKPTSFRAGGWWAELHNLQALAEHGFVADGSGCNYARVFDVDTVDSIQRANYEWFRTTWPTMNDTTQPYRPSVSDVSRPGPPSLSLVELPDNGVLNNFVTAQEMIEIFAANWDGAPLLAPRQYSIGYHPMTMEGVMESWLIGALDHVSGFRAADGNGPVVFACMSELALVW